MITLLVILIILMGFLGVPLFAMILAATMLGFYTAEVDFTIIAVELYRLAGTPMLIALPLFAFVGYILSESNTSQKKRNI